MTTTVAEAKAHLRAHLQDGTSCPVCNQHVQEYRWSLYGTAVQALRLYWQIGDITEWVHTRQIRARGHTGQGDAARLKWWGLIEHEKEHRPDGGRSGYWRVTEAGREFLFGRKRIPKYVYVYDGQVLRFDGDMVTVRECLGSFDYNEFVRGL